MARDAYKFFIPALIAALLFVVSGHPLLALICFILASFICYFFRNPKREIPQGRNLVVSPADGKVVKISQMPDGTKTISIFLNIFNVHVNRAPISGRLEQFEYKRGKFKVAFDEEASKVNEQNILTICGQDMKVVVRQIAGLIARRVICWKKAGRKPGTRRIDRFNPFRIQSGHSVSGTRQDSCQNRRSCKGRKLHSWRI